MSVVALIPAYKPSKILITTAKELLNYTCFSKIICIDDGSGEKYNDVFCQLEELGIVILRHAINLGKGNALKTGFNYIALNFPDSIGVVTLDADGQHLPEDCANVAKCLMEHPNALVMGVRTFKGNDIPLRSKIGNVMTSKILKFFVSIDLEDTQTGLRGIPLSFLSYLLKLNTGGYEFELDMLMLAHDEQVKIIQTPIKTIYYSNNESSHFSPFFDSFKIYMVFLRFNFSSLATFLVDTLIFVMCGFFGLSLISSIFVARFFAGVLNYTLNKNFVFKCDKNNLATMASYALTVVFMGMLSYGLMSFIISNSEFNVYIAKITSELLIYVASFIIQRDFVFNKHKKHNLKEQTDWKDMYAKRSIFSYLTAKFAFVSFYNEIDKFIKNPNSILELGGANSIFYMYYKKFYATSKLILVDQCESTKKFSLLIEKDSMLNTVKSDILLDTVKKEYCADLVVSFGLIEHFNESGTACVIAKHFEYANPNGIIFCSFPTPTRRYIFTRGVLEFIDKWQFHDERPLLLEEVQAEAEKYGILLASGVCHRLGLSQRYVIYRKKN